MMEHLFDRRPDRPGYRLHRLEVFNWGTFDSSDGTIHRFEPQGRTSLLVGHNGSGKSTLVDALLTLLVDSRSRNYNVAAGARKTERTARSYIRGAYDRTADESQATVVKYLRPHGDHLSAISAVFRDEQLDKAFTLTQVLYAAAESEDRVYALADHDRELQDVLCGLTKSDQIREHLKRHSYQTAKTYVEYQGWLAKRTQMHSKAIDMFNQTVHVKDIQSLNSFIRQHMLEGHDWRDKVQRLLTHFNDLSVAHQELVRARRAVELLLPVESFGLKYKRQAAELANLEQQLEAASTCFPLQVVQLLEPEIVRREQEFARMEMQIARLDEELDEQREVIRQLRNEIDQAGGERLKAIPGLIQAEQTHLKYKTGTYHRFHEHVKICGIPRVADNRAGFQEVCLQLQRTLNTADLDQSTLRLRLEATIGEKAGVERLRREEVSELELLQQRRTNLPRRCAEMRCQICADLGLDENILPFAAELMAVSPEHRHWEPSIEMVLRSFGLSLLVPERYYPRVRAYVERHPIKDEQGEGQRLDYLCVGKPDQPHGDRIHPQSLVNKLQFRSRHDLSPWVRGEILKRFDFRCCEDVDEFNEIPRLAMTANRHVKFSTERHQKDDRRRTVDPRHFVLGWDNTEKKRRIAEHVGQLDERLARLAQMAAACERDLEQVQAVRNAATAALEVAEFDDLDLHRHEAAIAALMEEKQQLEEANDVVKVLRDRLADQEAAEHKLSRQRDECLDTKGQLKQQLEDARRMLHNAAEQVEAARRSGQYQRHQPLFASIWDSLGEGHSLDSVVQRQQAWKRETERRVASLRQPLEELADKLVNRMSQFLREFREEANDLDATVKALDSFLGLLDQYRREDLPKYEKKFKDRLNDQVSQEVALFYTALREEAKRIVDKIALLNEALAEVNYSRGTRMQLEARQVKDREIDDFRRSLRECLDESLEDSDDANESRFVRIKQLVERLADNERTTWRNKVIDVRNWFDFAALEINRETGERQSCYDGSSGQSGGEKAKLAFTILVAALAYQFDIDPKGNTPGRFQFVVVDEMFSKVDDQNAKYALQLFKQFGLQLLIVAPLDAKARITEPFVDRYLHSVKDADTNCSQLYSMTAQEYQEVVAQLAVEHTDRRGRRPLTAR